MIRYVAARLGLIVLVALGVATMLFALSRIGSDPAVLLSPPDASQEVLEAARERHGLDRPLPAQYGDTLVSALTLDFGDSFAFGEPAFDMVRERLGASLRIILPAMGLVVVLSLAVGILAALRTSRPSGRAIMVGTFITQGVPYFWMALLLVFLLSIQLQWLPATGSEGWQSLVIPVIVLTLFGLSTLTRLVRGQMLDGLARSHVLTARSKGVSPRTVLLRHALPTAVPPALSYVGIQFSFMFGALLVIEPIMGINGIGGLLVDAVGRDFPLVQAGVFVIAMLITVTNIGIDVVLRLVDPRLRP